MKLFVKTFVSLLLPLWIQAQENMPIDTVANRLLNKLRSASTEQIILQTNKKIYSPKENIWFNALEVDSLTGRLRNTSKILYADLVDINDKVIHHVVLNMG